MRRAVLERAPCAVHQLPEGIGSPSGTADQLPQTESGVAAHRPRSLIRVHLRIFAASSVTLYLHAREASAACGRLRSNGEVASWNFRGTLPARARSEER